jgi:hypothetical protein
VPEAVASGAGGEALRWALARHNDAVTQVVAGRAAADYSYGLASRRLIARHLDAAVARRALVVCLWEPDEDLSAEEAAKTYVEDLRWFRARFGYAARDLVFPDRVCLAAARQRSRAVVAELLRWGAWPPADLHEAMDVACMEHGWDLGVFELFAAADPSYVAYTIDGEWLEYHLLGGRFDLVAHCVDGSLAALAALGALATPDWLEDQLRIRGRVDIARFCLARSPVAPELRPVLARAALERYVAGAPPPFGHFDLPVPEPAGLAAFASEQLELYAAGV